MPSVPISVPKSVPNACKGLTGFEKFWNWKISKCKDMQGFDTLCHAYHLFPNYETFKR